MTLAYSTSNIALLRYLRTLQDQLTSFRSFNVNTFTILKSVKKWDSLVFSIGLIPHALATVFRPNDSSPTNLAASRLGFHVTTWAGRTQEDAVTLKLLRVRSQKRGLKKSLKRRFFAGFRRSRSAFRVSLEAANFP